MNAEKKLPDEEGWWWFKRGECQAIIIYHLNADVPIEGRYIKAEPPEFFDYPPKPPQVLVKSQSGTPYWIQVRDSIVWSREIVVDHPDNDPEGVRMIEEARENHG